MFGERGKALSRGPTVERSYGAEICQPAIEATDRARTKALGTLISAVDYFCRSEHGEESGLCCRMTKPEIVTSFGMTK
jgi:hypothetical protein